MTPHAEHPEPAPCERDTGANAHPKHKAAVALVVVHRIYVVLLDTTPPSR